MPIRLPIAALTLFAFLTPLSGTLAEDGTWCCLRHRAEAAAWYGGEAVGPRYDAATGADLRNYPPDRIVDIEHIALTIDIEDMNKPAFEAEAWITFRPIGMLEVLTLDARQFRIDEVGLLSATRDGIGVDALRTPVENTPLAFSYDDEQLTVRFDPPLLATGAYTMRVRYGVEDPVDGLFWTPESEAWPGRPAQIHTQGQPETNSYWFPCRDFPNERCGTSLVVTAPEGYQVSSNGRLADVTTLSRSVRGEDGRPESRMFDRYTWVQDKQHVAYLVTLVIGKFEIIRISSPDAAVPMDVWVPEGWGEKARQTYRHTERMLEVFEQRFDEPYPWDRYDQLVVWNFGAGGMENTAATTMYDTAALDEIALRDADLDGLISHELAHQWFGDLLTCNTWAHIWLNEGWATYSTALWYEARDGYTDGYQRRMHGTMRSLARRDQLEPETTNFRPAMVSTVYQHPWDVFRRISNPYPKGASVLHMLRMELGERVFFEGVAAYIDRFRDDTVETDQFRRELERVSNRSLERFFEQWTARPGTPRVKATGTWDEARGELKLIVEQTQRIDADLPAFVFDLPVTVLLADGRTHEDVIAIDGRRHERTYAFDQEPSSVLIDPDLHILMDLHLHMPEAYLRGALVQTSSLPARLDAAHALRSKNTSRVRAALRDVLIDADEMYEVRRAAATSLGEMIALDALAQAATAGIEDPRVRLAVIEAMGATGDPRMLAYLRTSASDAEISYACRAAALESVGMLGDGSDLPLLLAGLDVESQHDNVRAGAIRGLRELDVPAALDAVIPFTGEAYLSRLRPVAIEAVAELAHHDSVKAYEAIVPLLRDRQARTVRAAGAALVTIGDERALDELDRMAAADRHPVKRERASEWHGQLAAKLARSDSGEQRAADIERLRREIEVLRESIEKK
ncbi:MAG: M1 family aminopeptidase [Planctomycetota bacterium]